MHVLEKKEGLTSVTYYFILENQKTAKCRAISLKEVEKRKMSAEKLMELKTKKQRKINKTKSQLFDKQIEWLETSCLAKQNREREERAIEVPIIRNDMQPYNN